MRLFLTRFLHANRTYFARKRHAKKIPGRGGCGKIFFLLLSEAIVDAGAQHSEPVTVRHAGNGEVVVGEIDIEIFDLGAPVRREAEFRADARGPASAGVGFRQSECLTAQLAERQTAGAEQQNVAEGVAGAAAHRAEPRVRELPGSK